MVAPWEKQRKERYALWYPMEPIICPACHRRFRGTYRREVPYHRDNSDRGVCSGSRRTLHDSAHKYPGSLSRPPSTALAWYATRQLRRGTKINDRRRSSYWAAYEILRSTVERDRVHEALGYSTFADYFQKEIRDFSERRQLAGGFWRRWWPWIRSRPPG
jgi:hypothetical protein